LVCFYNNSNVACLDALKDRSGSADSSGEEESSGEEDNSRPQDEPGQVILHISLNCSSHFLMGGIITLLLFRSFLGPTTYEKVQLELVAF